MVRVGVRVSDTDKVRVGVRVISLRDSFSVLLRPQHLSMLTTHGRKYTSLKKSWPGPTDLYNYWTKHASNDPSTEMQGAAVTCYIPTGR